MTPEYIRDVIAEFEQDTGVTVTVNVRTEDGGRTAFIDSESALLVLCAKLARYCNAARQAAG